MLHCLREHCLRVEPKRLTLPTFDHSHWAAINATYRVNDIERHATLARDMDTGDGLGIIHDMSDVFTYATSLMPASQGALKQGQLWPTTDRMTTRQGDLDFTFKSEAGAICLRCWRSQSS